MMLYQREYVLLCALTLSAAPAAYAVACPGAARFAADSRIYSENETRPPRERIEIAGESFELELALDPETRAKGLAGREKIEDHGGMLFVFPQPQRLSFWMADCFTDIDLIYLDRRGRVVRTHKMKAQEPQRDDESRADYERRLHRYTSGRTAQFVIELQAGSIDQLEIETGQTIRLDTERLAKRAR